MNALEEVRQLNAFVDGQLDLASQIAMEGRLKDDAAFMRQVESIRQLQAFVREVAEYHAAPSAFRERLIAKLAAQHGADAADAVPTQTPAQASVESSVEASPQASPRATPAFRPKRPAAPARASAPSASTWRGFAWRPVAASFGLAAGLAIAANLAWLQSTTVQRMADDVVASHVRSTLGQHLLDVSSSDHHTVKPFLSARLGYSPPVNELRIPGSEFLGGRVDYLDGRPVAALVYKQGQHVVNAFVWPATAGDSRPALAMERGFRTAHWVHDGMNHWVVSDVNKQEFEAVVGAIEAAEAKP